MPNLPGRFLVSVIIFSMLSACKTTDQISKSSKSEPSGSNVILDKPYLDSLSGSIDAARNQTNQMLMTLEELSALDDVESEPAPMERVEETRNRIRKDERINNQRRLSRADKQEILIAQLLNLIVSINELSANMLLKLNLPQNVMEKELVAIVSLNEFQRIKKQLESLINRKSNPEAPAPQLIEILNKKRTKIVDRLTNRVLLQIKDKIVLISSELKLILNSIDSWVDQLVVRKMEKPQNKEDLSNPEGTKGNGYSSEIELTYPKPFPNRVNERSNPKLECHRNSRGLFQVQNIETFQFIGVATSGFKNKERCEFFLKDSSRTRDHICVWSPNYGRYGAYNLQRNDFAWSIKHGPFRIGHLGGKNWKNCAKALASVRHGFMCVRHDDSSYYYVPIHLSTGDVIGPHFYGHRKLDGCIETLQTSVNGFICKWSYNDKWAIYGIESSSNSPVIGNRFVKLNECATFLRTNENFLKKFASRAECTVDPFKIKPNDLHGERRQIRNSLLSLNRETGKSHVGVGRCIKTKECSDKTGFNFVGFCPYDRSADVRCCIQPN